MVLLVGVLACAAALFAAAVLVLVRRRRGRRQGTLQWTENDDRRRIFRSVRFRLYGRPDEIRQLPDGRWIPIELKRRARPAFGVPTSHRFQLWAYCLLLEETYGVPPPFGVVRYGDGTEMTLPWDREALAELTALRSAVDRPYDGRANPSPARCRRCPWRFGCDRSAA
jgi:CRISPR-associated exonuclease Cas4